MKIELPKGIVASSETRVRCVYCAVLIPKAKKCIKQHLKGSKHLNNFYSRIDFGIECVNNVLHCRPCDRALSKKESVVEHSEEETHSFRMDALADLVNREFFEVESYIGWASDYLYCEACFERVNCSLECIEEHVKRFDHQTNAVVSLAPRNGIFNLNFNSDSFSYSDSDSDCKEDEEVIDAWCKICDIHINNTTQDIRSHINDENHRLWFTDVYNLIDHHISINNYLMVKAATEAYCNYCGVHVPCNLLELHEHIHTEPHLRL